MTSPISAAAQVTGTCVGSAWIDGEKAGASDGPDFTIYTVKAASGAVNIYLGCCSQVFYDHRSPFLRIDGANLQRTVGARGFTGYLAVQRRGIYETHLHFFGAGLTGDDRDRTFFRRVRFGKFAAVRCTGKRQS